MIQQDNVSYCRDMLARDSSVIIIFVYTKKGTYFYEARELISG
jgi:uncharacterized protein YdhG (YjbR/CyaY superfamily)